MAVIGEPPLSEGALGVDALAMTMQPDGAGASRRSRVSEQFKRLMADHGVICSMSRSGNVWDNTAMESFFSSLKTERTAREP